MDYGFEHNGKVYTPNGSTVSTEENASRNAAIEAAELAAWDMRPIRLLAYYRFIGEEQRPNKVYRESFSPLLTGASVSTWNGSRLGTIIEARVYRHNLGGRFISMRVRGSNGAMYHGRASYDWGACIVLHRSKGGK